MIKNTFKSDWTLKHLVNTKLHATVMTKDNQKKRKNDTIKTTTRLCKWLG